MIEKDPRGIFVDYCNRVFVAPRHKDYILVWSEDNVPSQWNLSFETHDYPGLFVTTNDDAYFQGKYQGKIYKWSKNTNNSIPIKEFNVICHAIFIDTNNTLYCSATHDKKVYTLSLNVNGNVRTTVAGTESGTSSSNDLLNPRGIFVDTHFSLYVADFARNRVQCFSPGKLIGETVAGDRIPSNLTLIEPSDVVLDADGDLYIVEQRGGRIIRVGPSDYQCIAGCNGTNGGLAHELNGPTFIRFDSYGLHC